MLTIPKPGDVLVPLECGCVERWMPKMEDFLGTIRCATHQRQYDEATKDIVVVEIGPKSVGELILHYAGLHVHAIRLEEDPVTGEWVEDPTCMCGLPRLK